MLHCACPTRGTLTLRSLLTTLPPERVLPQPMAVLVVPAASLPTTVFHPSGWTLSLKLMVVVVLSSQTA